MNNLRERNILNPVVCSVQGISSLIESFIFKEVVYEMKKVKIGGSSEIYVQILKAFIDVDVRKVTYLTNLIVKESTVMASCDVDVYKGMAHSPYCGNFGSLK